MRRSLSLLIVALAATALGGAAAGCAFPAANARLQSPEDVARVLDGAPIASASDRDRWTVSDDGKIAVQQGYACSLADRAATATTLGIRIQEAADIPAGREATVILNGWNLEYRNGDHHVVGLGSTIFNVARVVLGPGRQQLHWDAGGLISDDDGDDPYRWCYTYTLLSWPIGTAELPIGVAHSDASHRLIFMDPAGPSRTALHGIAGAFTSPGGPRLPLLTGFGFTWKGVDHHVLEVGFDLGTATPSGDALRWSSTAVLKDNARSRPYRAAEIVSVLSGSAVTAWQPDTMLVRRDSGPWRTVSNHDGLTARAKTSCPDAVVGGGGEHSREIVIENVPFDYAVPMLSGWEIGDLCADHHVEKIGVWLTDFRYDKAPGASTGTLHLTVDTAFKDDPGLTGSLDSAEKITIRVLGIDKQCFSSPLSGRCSTVGIATSAP